MFEGSGDIRIIRDIRVIRFNKYETIAQSKQHQSKPDCFSLYYPILVTLLKLRLLLHSTKILDAISAIITYYTIGNNSITKTILY